MTNNSRTNSLVKYWVIVADFVLLNLLLYLCVEYYPRIADWTPRKMRFFAITLNVALLISHYYNSPIVHLRVISVGDIIKRVIKLDAMTVLIAYLMMKGISLSQTRVGIQLMEIGTAFFVILLIARYFERMIIKYYRHKGRNTRMALFIGSDSELLNIYQRLNDDASKGYKVTGYYANKEMADIPDDVHLKQLGSLDEFMDRIRRQDGVGD